MIKKLLLTLFLACLVSSAFAQQKAKDSVAVEKTSGDGNVNYSKKLLSNEKMDFKLSKTGSGQFLVSFYNNERKPIVIKIYDITGNLVKQETVVEKGSFSKEYNLSYYKPSFFVVEVGNSKYNRTKSIMAE